jgi:hypothetical protein
MNKWCDSGAGNGVCFAVDVLDDALKRGKKVDCKTGLDARVDCL